MPPSMAQRRRIRAKQGRSERGNVFEDTRVGRALAEALGEGVDKARDIGGGIRDKAGDVKDFLTQPSNLERQSFAERRSNRPLRRRKSKSTPESRKAAQRRNEAKARGQAKGRANYYRDRLDRDKATAKSKNQAGRAVGEMKGRWAREDQMRDPEYWTPIFEQMEMMGAMPEKEKDVNALAKVLAPDESSAVIEPIKEAIEEYDSAAMDDIGESPTRDATFRNMPESVKNTVGDVPPRDFVGEFEPEFEPEGLTGVDLLSYGVGEPQELGGDLIPEGLGAYDELDFPSGDEQRLIDSGMDAEAAAYFADRETPQMSAGRDYSSITERTRELNNPITREMQDLYTRAQGGDSQARYDLIDMQNDLERAERQGGRSADPSRRGIYRTEATGVPQSLLDRVRADNAQWKRGGTSQNRRRLPR